MKRRSGWWVALGFVVLVVLGAFTIRSVNIGSPDPISSTQAAAPSDEPEAADSAKPAAIEQSEVASAPRRLPPIAREEAVAQVPTTPVVTTPSTLLPPTTTMPIRPTTTTAKPVELGNCPDPDGTIFATPPEGVRVELTLDKTVYQQGEPITGTVVVYNDTYQVDDKPAELVIRRSSTQKADLWATAQGKTVWRHSFKYGGSAAVVETDRIPPGKSSEPVTITWDQVMCNNKRVPPGTYVFEGRYNNWGQPQEAYGAKPWKTNSVSIEVR